MQLEFYRKIIECFLKKKNGMGEGENGQLYYCIPKVLIYLCAGRTMDFSFDHSQIPIIGRKALELPIPEGESEKEVPPATESVQRRSQGGAGDSSHSTLERRHGEASGVSLAECAWKKSGLAQVHITLCLLFCCFS